MERGGLWREVACGERWPVERGGLWREVACGERWPVERGGLAEVACGKRQRQSTISQHKLEDRI